MKKIIFILFSLLVFASCKKHDDTGQGSYDIFLEYKLFHQNQLLVPVGTTVNFVNKDGSSHTVLGTLFSSGYVKPGTTYSHTFAAAGTYYFSCSLHNNRNSAKEEVYIKVQ